jgi:hypothetical protein
MRRTVLIAIAGCLATAAIVALAGYFYERPTSLKVAVTRDTDDFKLMTAIAHVFGKERESIRFKLDPVNDAAASAARRWRGRSRSCSQRHCCAAERTDAGHPAPKCGRSHGAGGIADYADHRLARA